MTVLFFQHFKNGGSLLSVLYGFLLKFIVIWICSSIGKASFLSLSAFKIFVFSWQKFYHDMSCRFPEVILFRVCLESWICMFTSCYNLEVFSHSSTFQYFKYFFISALFFLFYWDIKDKKVRSFVIVQQLPEAMFIFFHSFFFLLLIG